MGFEQAVDFILAEAHGAVPEEILIGVEFAGIYGVTFAHYLHERGFQIVSVLPADTKSWKRVVHRKALKTDEKDAATITEAISCGHYVAYPFLKPEYAELRYLVSTRESVSLLRSAALTRLKGTLQIVYPEFESIFPHIQKPTPTALLRTFPGPDEIIAAPKRAVLKVIRSASRGHLGEGIYEELRKTAELSVALRGSQDSLKREIRLLLEQIDIYTRQIRSLEASMIEVLQKLPEAACLCSIPGVAAVSAAVFLGCIGDVQAYNSARQILNLAGLSLVESSSGMKHGNERISKAGRPLLRRHAFLLGMRSIRTGGLHRAEFVAHLKRNGGRKMPAIVAVSRQMLRLMFCIARERRPFTKEPPLRKRA